MDVAVNNIQKARGLNRNWNRSRKRKVRVWGTHLFCCWVFV